jgi:RecB family exonuclease
MNGFIDLVVRTPTGDILLVDHKTTARQPSSSFEIGFNEQLLVYGWALYKKFGIKPHRIALNYVRFDRLVDAPFDMERAEAAIARQEAAVRGVRSGVFIKQNPTSFHQQCHNKFLKRTCAYLSHCHPDYATYIERSADND